MKWLEIIELRSAESNRELLESQLQKIINEVDKETKKQVIKTYSRVMIDTDFSIHLFHDSIKVESSGSFSANVNKMLSLIPIPFIIAQPGFRSKKWMLEQKTGIFQGFYEWDTIKDAENYWTSFPLNLMKKRAVPNSLTYSLQKYKVSLWMLIIRATRIFWKKPKRKEFQNLSMYQYSTLKT